MWQAQGLAVGVLLGLAVALLVEARAELGTEVVVGRHQVAAPRGVPVGPRDVGPAARFEDALDLGDDRLGARRVLEHVGAEDAVDRACVEREGASVAEDVAGRRRPRRAPARRSSCQSG